MLFFFLQSFLMELQMLDFRILCFWFLVVITKCGSQEGKILHSKWLYFVIKGINVCYKGTSLSFISSCFKLSEAKGTEKILCESKEEKNGT